MFPVLTAARIAVARRLVLEGAPTAITIKGPGGFSGERRCAMRRPFLFIGADPDAHWPRDAVTLDDRGLVVTGGGFAHAADRSRPPLPLETSHPRIFAMGDVRAGSTKRAAAAGEGAAVLAHIHAMPADHG